MVLAVTRRQAKLVCIQACIFENYRVRCRLVESIFYFEMSGLVHFILCFLIRFMLTSNAFVEIVELLVRCCLQETSSCAS